MTYNASVITKEFKNLLGFYLSFLLLLNFSSSIMPAHFLIQGITFRDMALGQILNFLPVILLLYFTKSLSSRISWIISIIIYLLFILFQVKIDSNFQFLFAKFFSGGIMFYFFLPYNIAHFKATLKESVGNSSAIMFSLGPIISVIAPIFAGILTNIDINSIWIVTFIIGATSLYISTKQENFLIKIDLVKSIKEIKFTKWLLLAEGVWEALLFSSIPIFTLVFIKTYVGYAIFVSYLAAIGAIANIIFGRMTDKIKKRAIFLYPTTILLGIVTMFFPLAVSNYILWIVLVSIINLILPIFWNLSTAIVVDSVTDTDSAMPAREGILATGRIIGSTLVLLSLIYETEPKNIFIVLGASILIYPMIMFWNSKIKKYINYF